VGIVGVEPEALEKLLHRRGKAVRELALDRTAILVDVVPGRVDDRRNEVVVGREHRPGQELVVELIRLAVPFAHVRAQIPAVDESTSPIHGVVDIVPDRRQADGSEDPTRHRQARDPGQQEFEILVLDARRPILEDVGEDLVA